MNPEASLSLATTDGITYGLKIVDRVEMLMKGRIEKHKEQQRLYSAVLHVIFGINAAREKKKVKVDFEF